jgi:threonine dehydrogenase-like Zn-dependent dehydrogenase
VDPGPSSGLKKGDLVVGIVRRPDPVPCPSCAVGEWDMCRNGQYTERGIKEIHGFMSERWRIEPEYALKLVLRNNVIVGSVNANKRHWYKASQALARADRAWLSRLITRREKPEDFEKALGRTPDDIEVVLQFSEV